MREVLVEPYDSGDHSGSGSCMFVKPDSTSSSSKKIFKDEDGWSQQRRQRGATVTQATDHDGKMQLKEGDVDSFIDLESTTIHIASAPNNTIEKRFLFP